MHVSTSVDYWDEVGRKFYSKYKGINDVHLKWQQEALETGRISSELGLFWPIPFNPTKIPWTIICNYPVQGIGAEVMKFARVMFWKRLRKNKELSYVKPVSTVHDSIVTDSPKELKQEVVNLFHQVFDDIPVNIQRVYGYRWTVPLDCECKGGANFKEQEKFKRTDK